MPEGFPRAPLDEVRRVTARAVMLLILPLFVAGAAACESDKPVSRGPAKATAEEVFEAIDDDAVIEEETIAPPPRPAYLPPETISADPTAPPPDADGERRRRPISSPGAAPRGTAPPQPFTTE